MSVRLDHLNLSVKDFGVSAKWYRDVFNFQIVEEGVYGGAPWGVLRAGDSMLCIYESTDRVQLPEEEESYLRINHFALRLTDKQEWVERATRLGLKFFYGGEVSYPHSSSWYVEDPSGYSIEVVFWNQDQVRFDR